MAVIAVAVLRRRWLLGYNLFLSRREVRRIIESLRSEMRSAREEDFAELEKRVKEEIDKLKKTVKEDTENEIKLFNAKKTRLFALTAWNAKEWVIAAGWWMRAMEGYAKVEKESKVRLSVKGLIKSLRDCKMLKGHDKKEIESYLRFIPEILADEKKQIQAKLDELSKR